VEVGSPEPSQSATADSAADLQFRTEPNSFGLYRVYSGRLPTYDPDLVVRIDDVCDSGNFNIQPDVSLSRPWWSAFGSSLDTIQNNFFAPFLNATVFRLMSWFYSTSSLKSLSELQRLVDKVINQDDFQKEDLQDFNANREAALLDTHTAKAKVGPAFLGNDGWTITSVKISVPCPGVEYSSERDAPTFEVHDLFIRRPLEVLKDAFNELSAERMHIRPYELWWQEDADHPPERCYSELYNSNAFLEEQRELDDSRGSISNTESPAIENVIAGYMFYSDSTHLANFGTASLWPAYTAFGNVSKYTRCKPTTFSIHHQAYFPKVSI
jgi:hypothetical protein